MRHFPKLFPLVAPLILAVPAMAAPQQQGLICKLPLNPVSEECQDFERKLGKSFREMGMSNVRVDGFALSSSRLEALRKSDPSYDGVAYNLYSQCSKAAWKDRHVGNGHPLMSDTILVWPADADHEENRFQNPPLRELDLTRSGLETANGMLVSWMTSTQLVNNDERNGANICHNYNSSVTGIEVAWNRYFEKEASDFKRTYTFSFDINNPSNAIVRVATQMHRYYVSDPLSVFTPSIRSQTQNDYPMTCTLATVAELRKELAAVEALQIETKIDRSCN